ncbi:hypothetical protein GJU39_13655 [Pedobacter petrophilus]|uniref:Uncharacterized protein n=1 Tax=Pedobacter petrophilus TaxID=1908241 RepID=A0A7K0FZV5_9SPHI|nr:hypothetical protein [Pedobacter petrophilus]MRX77133.1 hypothetical protein [Pedobacter petrophilus]
MKIFLFDPEYDYELEDYEANLEEAIEAFYDLPDVEGAFFGIFDHNNRFVQFAWNAQDEWLIDIPSDSFETTGKAFQLYGSYDKCIKIINTLFDDTTVSQLQVQIENKTLFKDTDEPLLNPDGFLTQDKPKENKNRWNLLDDSED